jgi:hypothetical protein
MMAVADLRHLLPLVLTMTAASPLLAACGDSGGDSAGTDGNTNPTSVTNPTSATATTPTSSSSETSPTSGDSATGSSTGAAGSESATGSETSASATTEDVLKLDVGNDTTTGGPQEAGCRKVDFLFIIDNSGSMSDEQENLINSFPSFIETIQAELEEAQDYHIMVIDTDPYVFGGCELICPAFFNTCPMAFGQYECGVTKPEMCEDVLGAGVTFPKGTSATNQDCAFTTQARYMDVTEPDLAATFACAATVGTGSTDDPEKPMEAMVAAIAPKGKAADCNLGFLRSDAILVVTFITDEDDSPADGSLGTVEGWKASLIAAKKGDETALVVLGLFGDGDQPNGICPPLMDNTGAEPSPRLRQFVDSFGERGVAGSVCAPTFKDFFADAVGIIDSTCDGFVPPPM